GLMTRSPLALTAEGEAIAAAATKEDAAKIFCKHIVDSRNGMAIIDAVRSLNARGDKLTKDSLKRELVALGIEGLSNATTDHTTLLNWMIEAGIFQRNAGANPAPDEMAMKAVLGISGAERSHFMELTLPQQIFLQ